MLEQHSFASLEFWRLGPIRNQLGYEFTLAEIGEVWFLEWRDPEGNRRVDLYPDHKTIVDAIHEINQGRRIVGL